MRRPGFETGSGHAGVCAGQSGVRADFLRVLWFYCQFAFHRLLHNHHHLSSGAGTIGQTVAAVPSGLSLTPLRIKITIQSYHSPLYTLVCSQHRKMKSIHICRDNNYTECKNIILPRTCLHTHLNEKSLQQLHMAIKYGNFCILKVSFAQIFFKRVRPNQCINKM
jgi:hypothetical protein